MTVNNCMILKIYNQNHSLQSAGCGGFISMNNFSRSNHAQYGHITYLIKCKITINHEQTNGNC